MAHVKNCDIFLDKEINVKNCHMLLGKQNYLNKHNAELQRADPGTKVTG